MDRQQQRAWIKKFENAGELLRNVYFVVAFAFLFWWWSFFPDGNYIAYIALLYVFLVVGGYFFMVHYIRELMRPPPKRVAKSPAKSLAGPKTNASAKSTKDAP